MRKSHLQELRSEGQSRTHCFQPAAVPTNTRRACPLWHSAFRAHKSVSTTIESTGEKRMKRVKVRGMDEPSPRRPRNSTGLKMGTQYAMHSGLPCFSSLDLYSRNTILECLLMQTVETSSDIDCIRRLLKRKGYSLYLVEKMLCRLCHTHLSVNLRSVYSVTQIPAECFPIHSRTWQFTSQPY